MDMNIKEIKFQIAKNKKRIQRMKKQIEDAKWDIQSTRKAIRFWQGELKNAKKKSA